MCDEPPGVTKRFTAVGLGLTVKLVTVEQPAAVVMVAVYTPGTILPVKAVCDEVAAP